MRLAAHVARPQSAAVVVPSARVSEAILNANLTHVGFVFRQRLDFEARLIVMRMGWEWCNELAKRWQVNAVYGHPDWVRQMLETQTESPSGRPIVFP